MITPTDNAGIAFEYLRFCAFFAIFCGIGCAVRAWIDKIEKRSGK